jgi:phosphoenolpyruvate carboxykinase (GTP)
VDREQWKQEVMGHEELFILLHDHLPPEMVYERELLICRLSGIPTNYSSRNSGET